MRHTNMNIHNILLLQYRLTKSQSSFMVNYLVLPNTKGNGLWRFKMKIQEVLMKVKWNKRVRSCFSHNWKIKIKHTVCLCYIAYLFWGCVYLKINMSVREWSWRKKRHLQKNVKLQQNIDSKYVTFIIF